MSLDGSGAADGSSSVARRLCESRLNMGKAGAYT
jgi:hypothetical protein